MTPNIEALDIIRSLDHKNVLEILDYGWHADRFVEISEYAEGVRGQEASRVKVRHVSLPNSSSTEFTIEVYDSTMKPCTCNGSNDNCRYCSGSGYVSNSTPIPGPPTPRPPMPISFSEHVPTPRKRFDEDARNGIAWESVWEAIGVFWPIIILFLYWLWKHV